MCLAAGAAVRPHVQVHGKLDTLRGVYAKLAASYVRDGLKVSFQDDAVGQEGYRYIVKRVMCGKPKQPGAWLQHVTAWAVYVVCYLRIIRGDTVASLLCSQLRWNGTTDHALLGVDKQKGAQAGAKRTPFNVQ